MDLSEVGDFISTFSKRLSNQRLTGISSRFGGYDERTGLLHYQGYSLSIAPHIEEDQVRGISTSLDKDVETGLNHLPSSDRVMEIIKGSKSVVERLNIDPEKIRNHFTPTRREISDNERNKSGVVSLPLTVIDRFDLRRKNFNPVELFDAYSDVTGRPLLLMAQLYPLID